MQISSFQDFIWQFYALNKRDFAWRNIEDPYRVVVSEIMLQQTQTYRVIPKYEQFIEAFSSFEVLANASLHEVMSIWQGLGYNRRAKFLHQLAQIIANDLSGKLPSDPEILQKLPGIGPNTAGSICAFAFNKPVVFIETNIRTVFIHSFFKGQEKVHDKEIIPLIQATVDQNNPREWYCALMDYGVYLKQTLPNPNIKSVHYSVQSKFEGSDRQIRGKIIRLLTDQNNQSKEQLQELITTDTDRFERILGQLIQERLVVQREGKLSI